MLTLIFSRVANRRPVGLLALGEWSPATGAPAAVSGTITTANAGQEDIASGAVVEPVVTVVGGGGGGGWIWPRAPVTRLEITGRMRTAQARQESVLTGDMVDTELELIAAILLASA